jgi:hypothetical protein
LIEVGIQASPHDLPRNETLKIPLVWLSYCLKYMKRRPKGCLHDTFRSRISRKTLEMKRFSSVQIWGPLFWDTAYKAIAEMQLKGLAVLFPHNRMPPLEGYGRGKRQITKIDKRDVHMTLHSPRNGMQTTKSKIKIYLMPEFGTPLLKL